MTRPVKRPVTSHKAVADLARRQPLVWTPVRRYTTRAGARAVLSQIEQANPKYAAYGPAGSFEARAVDVGDETEVSVRPRLTARPFTPDRTETTEDGRTRTHITMKRNCNGCGEYVGDVTDWETDCAVEGRPLPDVRGECEHCAPVVALERAGCATWQVAPQSFTRVADEIDQLRPWVFTKGFWQPTGPEQENTVVGLRVGTGEDRVVAYWGDWIIRHPDGHFAIHPAPKAGAR